MTPRPTNATFAIVASKIGYRVRHPEAAAERPSKDTAETPIEIGFADFEDI
jgi:hypothetical protein